MGSEPAIVSILQHYFDDWELPKGTKRWVSCLCPFHGDTSPSASISTEFNFFQCRACGMRGDPIGLVMRKDGLRFDEAKRRTESILGGSYESVSRKPKPKSGRRVFGRPRS